MHAHDELLMGVVQCGLLGPLVLTIDGAQPPPELLWRKNVALFAYLVCSPSQRRTRDQLIGLLWPDKTDSSARQSLREAIRILRRHLGAESLPADGDTIGLNLQSLELDTDRFETLTTTDPDQAADLIRGEFLEGFAIPGAGEFDQWVATERLQWRRRSVDALLQVAKASLNAGDLRIASTRSTAALNLEPGSDAAVQISMRSLAQSGNRTAALEVYDRFATYMTDLGTSPQLDTEQLAKRVKEGRSWSVTPDSRTAAIGTRRPSLVGRRAETTQASTLWDECRRNRTAAVVVVEADPGVGKTRLADELLNRARLDGAVVVSIRGLPADESSDESGLMALADNGLLKSKGLRAADPAAIGAFAGRIRSWADEFPDARGDAGRMSLSNALTDVLRCVTEEEPVCLFLDDAYWFDVKTLNWMQAAMRDLSNAPILLWVNTTTSRPRVQIDDLRRRIGHEVSGLSLSLSPFEQAEIGELVQQTMTDYSPQQQERLARRIMSDTGGIPLLAVELLHAVESGMELETGPDVWPASLRTLSQTLPSDLPEAVVSAIRVGFRVLSKGAQDALRCVAVIGEGARAEVIGVGVKLAGDQLESALDELEWERWLETDGRGYAFVARIVRDVVLQDMVTKGQENRIKENVERFTQSAQRT